MNSQTHKPTPLTNYGGQAVLEGVMMRGRRMMAIAVRKPDGSIQTETRTLGGLYQSKISRIPFLRGVLLLWDTLGLGFQSLTFSAEQQGEEPISNREWATSISISLVVFLGVFILLPSALAHWTESALGATALFGNVLEGVIRLVFLLLYLIWMGRIPEIARVFAYHGAEHKTISAYEAGAELTAESVEVYPKEHPRCGTSFLVVLGILAILLFAIIGPLPFIERVLSRILAIPVLISFGYEYLRLTARFANTAVGRALSAPGLWTQRLTTRNPDRSMLEVAIAAFRTMQHAERPVLDGAAAVSPYLPADPA